MSMVSMKTKISVIGFASRCIFVSILKRIVNDSFRRTGETSLQNSFICKCRNANILPMYKAKIKLNWSDQEAGK